MSLALAIFAVACQGDPFQTLADPVARARDADRNAAISAFRSRAKNSLLHWSGAQILERHASSLDAPLNRFIKTHWTGKAMDEAKHRAALEALIDTSSGEPTNVLRMLALPHVGALGASASRYAKRLGMKEVNGRWAWGEYRTIALAAGDFSNPRGREALTGAVSSGTIPKQITQGSFTVRYADAMGHLNLALSGKVDCKTTWKALLLLRHAPRNAPAHVKALSTAFFSKATCGNCKGGSVTCSTCNGKRRADQTCPNCKGAGKLRPASAIGKTSIKVKCGACAGRGRLKNASCFTCAKKGTMACGSCNGKFWLDVCNRCLLGKVDCGKCKGKRQIQTPCPSCRKGRVLPDNDYAKFGFTKSCKRCKGRGRLFTPCTSCKKRGHKPCPACDGSSRTPGFRISASSIYSTTPCTDCRGQGWRYPGVAIPCLACCGLGVRLQPTSDPSQVLR